MKLSGTPKTQLIAIINLISVLVTTLYFAFLNIGFIKKYTVDIFFYDQWDYYSPLFRNASYLDMFRWQQGPHRMGLGLWLLHWLTPISHWTMGTENYLMLGILLLASIVALSLKVRLFGP